MEILCSLVIMNWLLFPFSEIEITVFQQNAVLSG